jgi:hypothetical protein
VSKITETQKGTIAENLVANHLILESKGRLSPFQPVADDGGIDLLIYDKETGGAVPLQIKSRTKTLRRNPKNVHFEIRLATFKGDQDAYVLAVFLDEGLVEVKRAWLIPMRELEQVTARRTHKLVLRPSIDMNSKDRYTPYRCEGISDVTRRLIDAFD